MAIRLTGTDLDGVVVNNGSDTWITRKGEIVANDGDAFSFGAFDDLNYFVQGDVFATSSGITATSGASSIGVVVGPGASVNADGGGVSLAADEAQDQFHNVVNDGAIVSEGSFGVFVSASSSAVTNNGTIFGRTSGVFMEGATNEVINARQTEICRDAA